MPPLFTITTERLRLTWSGPTSPPDATAPAGLLRVQGSRNNPALRVERDGEPVDFEVPLRLAEQTPYRVFARSLTGAPLALRHDDPLATRGLVADERGTILSGTIDFEGQVGRSRFVVEIDGEEEVAFEIDVFPTKATFAEVEAMRMDLDETLAGLAFEYLRSTTSPARVAGGLPHRATWLTLLRRTLPDLEAALEHIAARPHRELRREPQSVRANRIRRADTGLRRAVLQGRGTGEALQLGGRLTVRARLPERLAVDTLDTPEHRWLRARMDAARTTLAVLCRDEVRLTRSARRRQTIAHLEEAERRLARLLHLPPLAACISAPPPLPTQRLLTAPGYAEAYRACNTLVVSLALADGPVPHATRDLHLLYEMWCYLTVVRAVAERLGQEIPARAFFRADHRGVRLLLRRGRAHGVAFEHAGRRIELAYNPHFAAQPGLLAQRPDILLTVIEAARRSDYVLDAKYRRDEGMGYVRRYGVPGPPEEALGDLHRYRDAILDTADGHVRRTVHEAVALYPYAGPDAFADSRLWKSIATVGVGAIPLLPGATIYLDGWLATVLG